MNHTSSLIDPECDRVTILTASHRHELEKSSSIDPEVITERGYRSVTQSDRHELEEMGIPPWALRSDEAFPGLLIPICRVTGERLSLQFKPAKPILVKGKSLKYISARGVNVLDLHPRNRAGINDSNTPLWITEGVKKGDALTSCGCCVLTLTGVFNWRSSLATLGDWEDVPLKGREVIICFDADAKSNMNVARAMVRLGRWLRSKGVKTVHYLIVPNETNAARTKGVDDYFAAGGTLETLKAAATTVEPDTEAADDTFTDARLAETIADEVFADHFVWCRALGWLRFTGQRWTSVTDEAVGEAARKYAIRRFKSAVDVGTKAARCGWQSLLSASRLRSVISLTKGIVERIADEFDADPDVLNTPSGVVDLRTGRVQCHNPELLLTKMTSGSYRPGFTHPDWRLALTALPDETRGWLQTRLGQGITGHPTPDGIIPILQGGGENGKSAITTDGIVPALGDYAAPVSPKLIASVKDEHSTERADLRGQRLLIAEELTEDRALNVTAIKQITDVSMLKARLVFKDNLTFPASHSLFVTTNYIPVVNETDHGTWRRLALVAFPFTYRKPHEALTNVTDRRGDPHLKARLRAGGVQHDAIVTWLVEGAIRWYASGYPALPASIEARTRSWRSRADRILGFWDQMLRADEDSCILTTEMLSMFNGWMRSNGHHEWSKESFHGRFKGHVETVRHDVVERRPRTLPEGIAISRPPDIPSPDLPGRPCIYLGVRLRTPDDVSENTEEPQEWSERSDPSATCSREADSISVLEGSAQSDQTCCHGAELGVRCRLCRQLPACRIRAIEKKS